MLVRSNPNDGALGRVGPGVRSTLVRYDGSTVDLGTIPEGVGPAPTRSESIYVLAEARRDGFAAVVRDAETGETVQDGPASRICRLGYWPVPPLALDGGTLYVGYNVRDRGRRSGQRRDDRIVEGMAGGDAEIIGGRDCGR